MALCACWHCSFSFLRMFYSLALLFLAFSNWSLASLAFFLILVKKSMKLWVSFYSNYSEHRRPIWRIFLCSISLAISLSFVSIMCWTRNISRFFWISYHRLSRFFGLSTGMFMPPASDTWILPWTLGLIASADGSISVSQSFRSLPSRRGLFFSQTRSLDSASRCFNRSIF